jgi:hypothetical protein
MYACEMPAYNMPACEMHAYEMHIYDRSCLLEFLICERHTYKRLISIREAYLRAIYIRERSMPAHRRVFQSVHLRDVHLMGGRTSQGMRISWACASHKRVSQGRVSFAGMHLKGPIPCTGDTSYGLSNTSLA